MKTLKRLRDALKYVYAFFHSDVSQIFFPGRKVVRWIPGNKSYAKLSGKC